MPVGAASAQPSSIGHPVPRTESKEIHAGLRRKDGGHSLSKISAPKAQIPSNDDVLILLSQFGLCQPVSERIHTTLALLFCYIGPFSVD